MKLNSNEQKGITALLLILGVFILGGILAPNLFEPADVEVHISIDSLPNEVGNEKEINQPKSSEHRKREFNFHKFNPNEVTYQELVNFGFTDKEAKNWVNYLESGGYFKREADLLKLYAIDEAKLNAMKDFLFFPSNEMEENKTEIIKAKTYDKKPVTVAINTADTTALKQLKGVGSYFARKIVEYRTKLGGFYKKEQLFEIWNFNPEVLTYPENTIILDTAILEKLPLNTISKENLAKHPYLTWKQANSIVNLRNQHGKYRKIEDVKNSILITDSLYQKIYPYLSLE